MRNLLMALVSIGTIGITFSQEKSTLEQIEFYSDFANKSMVGKKLPPPNVDGSPYLYDEWRKGKVFLRGDEVFDNLTLKYNLYSQILHLKERGGERAFKDNFVEGFELIDPSKGSGELFRKLSFECDDEYYNDYFKIIDDQGDYGVYIRYWIYKKPPTYVEGLNTGNRNYELITKEQSFYRINESYVEINTSHKKNLKKLKQHQAIYELADKKNLPLKSADDFKSLFTHLSGGEN